MIPHKMVLDAWCKLPWQVIKSEQVRVALEAAGVGELIAALRVFAICKHGGAISADFDRARAVLEKIGVKL